MGKYERNDRNKQNSPKPDRTGFLFFIFGRTEPDRNKIANSCTGTVTGPGVRSIPAIISIRDGATLI